MNGCERWTIKKAECWRIDTFKLEKTLESPLDSKEIKPINPKGNQPWIFSGRTDAKALILWPPDVKRWLVGKDLDAGKDWRQQEKGTREDEMVGWHHWTSMDVSLSKLQQTVKEWEAWHAAVHGVTKSRAQLSDSTTISIVSCVTKIFLLNFMPFLSTTNSLFQIRWSLYSSQKCPLFIITGTVPLSTQACWEKSWHIGKSKELYISLISEIKDFCHIHQ